MTREQERTVELIRKEAQKQFFYGDKYEFKEFDVEENEYFVSVVAEVGLIGDEGTFAAVFCRDRVHLFVGKRGGVTYPVNSPKWRKKSLKRRYGSLNLYQVKIEQK